MKKWLFLTLLIALCGGIVALKEKRPHLLPLYWMVPYTEKDCGGKGFDAQTLKALNQIREETKVRYRIRSGYRSPEENERVGGAKNSQHIYGKAVDLWVPHSYRSDFYAAAKKAKFSAFGWNNTSVHIDQGPKRWWTYDDSGKNMSGKKRHKFLHKAPENFKKDFGLE